MGKLRTKISGLERNQSSSKEEIVHQGTFFHLREYSGLWATGGLGLEVTRGLTFSLEAPVSSVILCALGEGEMNGGKEGHRGTLCKSDFMIPRFLFFC